MSRVHKYVIYNYSNMEYFYDDVFESMSKVLNKQKSTVKITNEGS